MGTVCFVSQSHLLLFTLENIHERVKTPEQIIILKAFSQKMKTLDQFYDQVDLHRQVKPTCYWINPCQSSGYSKVGFHLFNLTTFLLKHCFLCIILHSFSEESFTSVYNVKEYRDLANMRQICKNCSHNLNYNV